MAERGDSFFKGFIFGGIIGAVIGVLLAPKSGRELREDIGEEAEKIFSHTKSDLENARKAALKSFEEGRDKIIEKLARKEEEEEEEEVTEVVDKPKRRSRRTKS